MAIEIFNRFESKYLIDQQTFHLLQHRLLEHLKLDIHNEASSSYSINNLYFDTEENTLIRTSLSKPDYKEKLRLRSYGVPNHDSLVYLEIKKKFNGRVNKRRSSLRLEEAYRFAATGTPPESQEYMNLQVISEIEYFLKIYKLVPKLAVTYDRIALSAQNQVDDGLRVTFDFNIRTRRHDLTLESGTHGQLLLNQPNVLMEIKTTSNIPLWLVKLLSEHQIYHTSFSKYGMEYNQWLQKYYNKKEVPLPCWNHCSTPQLTAPQYQ